MLNITGIPKINYLSELRYFVILSWIQLRSFLFHSFTYMKQDFNVHLKNSSVNTVVSSCRMRLLF